MPIKSAFTVSDAIEILKTMRSGDIPTTFRSPLSAIIEWIEDLEVK